MIQWLKVLAYSFQNRNVISKGSQNTKKYILKSIPLNSILLTALAFDACSEVM